jgi:probable HAF family extracellular repeat protein
MSIRTSYSRRPAVILALLAGTMAATAHAQPNTVIDLGTMDGMTSFGSAINAAGTVVGATTRADASVNGLVWNGTPLALAPLPGDEQCHAFDISDQGAVVAMSYTLGKPVIHGLLWEAGTITNLGAIAPRGLNGSGVVVGSLYATDALLPIVEHAARWQAGTITDLGTLGGTFSGAAGINAAGQIVGWSYVLGDINMRPTLWQAGSPLDLGTLGGTMGQAYAISDTGYVVGWSTNAAGEPHAFRYRVSPTGAVLERLDVGVLGFGSATAYGVNDQGDVVGASNARAFLWKSGTLTDLNTILPPGSDWTLEAAWGINNAGQIAGNGSRLGFPHAFLLTETADGACCIQRPAGASCVQAADEVACSANRFTCDVRTNELPECGGACGTICTGDANGDGVVNAADRGFISASIGLTDERLVCQYDLDGNGFINAADRGFVSANIGLCTPLPDWQNGSGLNHGVSDTRFGMVQFMGAGTTCGEVTCP